MVNDWAKLSPLLRRSFKELWRDVEHSEICCLCQNTYVPPLLYNCLVAVCSSFFILVFFRGLSWSSWCRGASPLLYLVSTCLQKKRWLEFGIWEATDILRPVEDGADGSLARRMRSTLALKSEHSSSNAGFHNSHCEWTDVRVLQDILLLLLSHFHRPAPPTLRAQPSTKYYIGLSRNRNGDLSISRRPLSEPMWVLFSPVATMNFWSQCCTFKYLISLLQVPRGEPWIFRSPCAVHVNIVRRCPFFFFFFWSRL